MAFNLFKRKECGTCKHWLPQYPAATKEGLGYWMGDCEQLTHSSGYLTADFATPIGKNVKKSLYTGRRFSCCRHEFK